jgi:hypothetical protein
LEEYSVAAHVSVSPAFAARAPGFCRPLTGVFIVVRLVWQIYKLPQSSLAELARNSVIQSGFEMEIKRHWLGQKWYLPGAAGNDINKVSSIFSCPLSSS